MSYFTVNKQNSLGEKLPKEIAQRLKEKGFEETQHQFQIPLQQLTNKNWKSVLPKAS